MEHVSALEQYGPVGLIAVIFASVIIVLWGRLEKQQARNEEVLKSQEKERGEFARERVELRAEYERKHTKLVEEYVEKQDDRDKLYREREDEVRSEFADLMERVESEHGKAATATTAVLQKFYDRFVGPNARGRY